MKKLSDFVIYRDPKFYAAFPSIVRKADGELLVAFRRAPERRWHGGKCTHGDPNSYLAQVRSRDDGETWTSEPELIHAHALGGSQDPCVTLLPNGDILCASYLGILEQPDCPHGRVIDGTGWKRTFAGGYLMRTRDGGDHWEGPINPPPVPGNVYVDPIGNPPPAYNRGNILVGIDGLLYWAVVRSDGVNPKNSATNFTSVHLIVSADGGDTWEYRCPIAEDDKISFNETFLYETEAGDLVAFLRTADPTGNVPNAIARSCDRGQSFKPWRKLGFKGHPHCAARLNDGRVLLAYGYRDEPYGVRGRVLDSECEGVESAHEFIIRDDGGSPDLGYPWAMVHPDGRVLVVYYFNYLGDIPDSWPKEDAKPSGTTGFGGIRHICGTWLRE